jgi:hypothetical protein
VRYAKNWGGFGDATTTTGTYKVGILVAGVFDSESKALIWRGSASDTISNNRQEHQESQQGGGKMSKHFPPATKKQSKAQVTKGDRMKSLKADQVKVGFIGLGNMGSRIAQRLLDHKYQLSVYDVDLAKAKRFAARGECRAFDRCRG